MDSGCVIEIFFSEFATKHYTLNTKSVTLLYILCICRWRIITLNMPRIWKQNLPANSTNTKEIHYKDHKTKILHFEKYLTARNHGAKNLLHVIMFFLYNIKKRTTSGYTAPIPQEHTQIHLIAICTFVFTHNKWLNIPLMKIERFRKWTWLVTWW